MKGYKKYKRDQNTTIANNKHRNRATMKKKEQEKIEKAYLGKPHPSGCNSNKLFNETGLENNLLCISTWHETTVTSITMVLVLGQLFTNRKYYFCLKVSRDKIKKSLIVRFK